MEKEEKRKSGFATAGLILGIIAICTSFIPIINNLSFILGFIGLIFGIVSLIKKASKGMAIAAIIICFLAMYFTYTAQQELSKSLDNLGQELNQMSGNSTDEILANSLDVSIGDFYAKAGSYGLNETKLPVTIKNKNAETKSFSVQIEAINLDGSRISTDYIYATNLSAGQTQTFDIFTFVSSDDFNAMKNATFKIVEVSMY